MPVELNDSGLRAFLAGLDDEIAAGNDAAADMIVDLGQQIAPVDEGDFKGSIKKRPGQDALSREVISDGADAPHNVFVEFGQPDNTAYPAQPTLGPAAEAIDPGIEVAKRLNALAARCKV
jgi:hypothetical protein